MNYWLSLVSIVAIINCTFSKTYYIVTSSSNHCPQEFEGEPCLTLEQYVSHPSQSSNITLIMESGNHFLRAHRFYTEISAGRIVITGEGSGANIIHESPTSSLPFYFDYKAWTIQINGVSFISSFVHITISRVRGLIVNNCNFQGVSFILQNVINATILRSTFSDFIYYFPVDLNYILGPTGALVLYRSSSVDIIQCSFTNNDIALYGYGGSSYSGQLLIHIEESIFTNNTSQFEGGAIHFQTTRMFVSISVNQSIFINNTASRSGGAIYINIDDLDFLMTESTFVQNSADSCGAINIVTYYDTNVVEINDTIFDSNRALRVSDSGGGALCITNTSALISNCSFVDNVAAGAGGAVVSCNSEVDIDYTVFHNNSAGGDGGVLVTYARPSNYTITQSTFTHNQAGDDGGAIFIGHRGSYVTLDMCTFSDNHAIDRGGAITIFGSTLEITETSIENNGAALGDTFSSCNSNVMTSLLGHRNINCSYDGPITSNSNTTTLLKCQDFTNIILDVTIGEFCTEREPSEPTTREVNKVTTAAYVSLTISAIVVIAFLLYLSIGKLVRSKIKCMKWPITSTVFTPATQLQSEPLYAKATVQANDNAEAIEMKPNVLYGKCEPKNQAHSQPHESTRS